MVIVDSNIWIAFFNLEDSTHKKSFEILSKYDKSRNKVAVTDMIVAEVCTVLKNKKKFSEAVKFLNFIDNHDVFIVKSKSYFKGTTEEFRHSGSNRLSFVDLSLLELAKTGYKIETLDLALKRKLKAISSQLI